MIDAVVMMTTTNSEREARSIAHLLVEADLAACVQIIPKIVSVYKWDKEIRSDQEYLLLIKTLEKKIKDVRDTIKKHHSYEIPELIALPIIDGLDSYLNWMADVTK